MGPADVIFPACPQSENALLLEKLHSSQEENGSLQAMLERGGSALQEAQEQVQALTAATQAAEGAAQVAQEEVQQLEKRLAGVQPRTDSLQMEVRRWKQAAHEAAEQLEQASRKGTECDSIDCVWVESHPQTDCIHFLLLAFNPNCLPGVPLSSAVAHLLLFPTFFYCVPLSSTVSHFLLLLPTFFCCFPLSSTVSQILLLCPTVFYCLPLPSPVSHFSCFPLSTTVFHFLLLFPTFSYYYRVVLHDCTVSHLSFRRV